jgi:hypothetical protein
MAQLVLISETTYGENINEIGDIVGVFEDSHVFSDHEYKIFDFLQVSGFTREELTKELQALVTVKDERDWKYPYSLRGATQESKDALESNVSIGEKKTLIAQVVQVESG